MSPPQFPVGFTNEPWAAAGPNSFKRLILGAEQPSVGRAAGWHGRRCLQALSFNRGHKRRELRSQHNLDLTRTTHRQSFSMENGFTVWPNNVPGWLALRYE